MASVESSHVSQSSSAQSAEEGEDFIPSKLGTKEYWDDAYRRELQTYKDIGDVGEIWFGEGSMNRVIKWMEKQNIPENAAILDIGTGNGVFLVELAKHGFTNLTGIDYSSASIELTRNILEEEGLININVQEQDFLNPSADLKDFDVCIDKGTFDAISLNPEGRDMTKLQYVTSLRAVLKPQGQFVITSCNWTKEQLLQIFSPGFELLQELPTPRFQFGGVTGNSVTALVFKRLS
ncbi:EEF1A lysine methyltransferase 2 isoform X1 [Colossoma macropomum]|uniref:EEF1A lysine methyltransferase 2 isoform X1 n=2 Tax=Colossoma macropomum TaxID=42526 RepID=UPI0018653E63|nr:EEF1A lysine methyltransferase 2 isoform X1 [Colossoma macropomum]XP_036450074.1 EEF1A lysine methyltransferase 2 isoform X1 [Colossoma macropomum]XP_036450075.1 EEF1A lysine methyltransferase 2 isoform X1 [Colossoma macropomum]